MSDTKMHNNARDVVQTLFKKGVRLLALDFDRTIISVHTSGFWRGPAIKLVEHVRPCFQILIEAALENNMHVCVVTFSMQPEVIKDVLRLALPARHDTTKILVRCNSADWVDQQSGSTPWLGKQQHLAWCVTQFYDQQHLIIHPHEILLIDDDKENICVALEFGHQAYHVLDDVGMTDLAEFSDAMKPGKPKPFT